MKHAHLITLALATMFVGGCSSRSTPPPPIDFSMDGDARVPDQIPYVEPSLPAGDLEKATDVEREAFMKLQHERMKKQQDEVDDIRRQKFQDGYYKSQYPNEAQ